MICKFCHFTKENHIDGKYCSVYRIAEFKPKDESKDELMPHASDCAYWVGESCNCELGKINK